MLGIIEHIANLGVRNCVPRLMKSDHVIEPRDFLTQIRVSNFFELRVILVLVLYLLPDGPLVILIY